MPNIQGRFSDQDSYILTQSTLTAVNNNAEFNVAQVESDFLRSTSASFVQQATPRTLSNPYPDVALAGQNTIGAALADINQPEVSPANTSVHGCFVGETLILTPNGEIPIASIQLGDYVKAFDSRGNFINAKVVGKWEHLVEESLLVTFEDGRQTHTTAIHKYWTGEHFIPIFSLDEVLHWDDVIIRVPIVSKEVIEKELIVYNITVDVFHTYIANGDLVSNLKPAPE